MLNRADPTANLRYYRLPRRCFNRSLLVSHDYTFRETKFLSPARDESAARSREMLIANSTVRYTDASRRCIALGNSRFSSMPAEIRRYGSVDPPLLNFFSFFFFFLFCSVHIFPMRSRRVASSSRRVSRLRVSRAINLQSYGVLTTFTWELSPYHDAPTKLPETSVRG